MSKEVKQLPERSVAKINHSLTPEAIKVVDQFGWDFFKAGVLIADECQPRIGDNDPETLYLLVKEAKVKEKQPDGSTKWVTSDQGKWNLPCGRLRKWETIQEAAYREGREESGYDFELGELCYIGHRFDIDNPYVIFIFSAGVEHLKCVAEPNPEEIASVGWFSYDTILSMRDDGELRNPELTLGAIEQYRKYKSVPSSLLMTYSSKYFQSKED